MNKKTTASQLLKTLFVASFLFSAGCSIIKPPSEAEQYAKMADDKFKGRNGSVNSVKTLQQDFFKITNSQLPQPYTESCKLDSECYYNRWANVYEYHLKEIKEEKQKKAEQEKAEKEWNACLKDPACIGPKRIADATHDLNMAYQILMANYRYEQGAIDMLIRQSCKVGGKHQRMKLSKQQTADWINSAEGIPPLARKYMLEAAEACWEMSRYGVPDGTVKIRNM
ncbi:hypothetical protein AB7X32_22050 [Morganella morganii]|uniref:hypothetical protein n=1 Tax=Morganella morganii TaxID=582 RepID=UPI0034E5640C